MFKRIHVPTILPLAGVAMPLLFMPACNQEEERESASPAVKEAMSETQSTEMDPRDARLNVGADIGDEPLLPGETTAIVHAFAVGGMTCSGRATTLNDAVSPLEGVDAVRVSLLKNILWVRLDAKATTTPEAIIQAVADAGEYTASMLPGEGG